MLVSTSSGRVRCAATVMGTTSPEGEMSIMPLLPHWMGICQLALDPLPKGDLPW